MRVRQQTFQDDMIVLDGSEFDGCRFVRCTIVYRAEHPTGLRDNEFRDCTFVFEGAARMTMGFIKGMAGCSDAFLVSLIKSFDLQDRLQNIGSESSGRVSAAPSTGLPN